MAVTFKPPNRSEQQDEQNTFVIRDHLPKGRAWGFISRFGKAIIGAMAACWGYAKDYTDYLKAESKIDTASDAIDLWEESVLLPDGCSIYASTLAQQRKQVRLRLKKVPYVRASEISAIVYALSGYEIIIKPRRGNNIKSGAFDRSRFDAPFASSADFFLFDVFINWEASVAFDKEPFGKKFDGQPRPRIVECLIKKIKPCNTIPVYHYSKSLYNQQKDLL